MSKAEHPSTTEFAVDLQGRPAIQRYTPNERSNHWIIAISFVLLALSGLALFHPALFWLTALFGGGPWTRILHPFIGLVMFVSFHGAGAAFLAPQLPGARDVQWMLQIGDVLTNREERLPAVGRYNAGQKLLFWSLLVSMVGLLLTGLGDLARVLQPLSSPSA